ncbi:SEL1-like repeat protein [Ketobacter sp.]
MSAEKFQKVYELEDLGEFKKAFVVLSELADAGYGLALFEMASRLLSPESYVKDIYPKTPDEELSKEYASRAFRALTDEALAGNGESMRMLAYAYLGLSVPFYENDISKGEQWLLNAFDAGCNFAANDLSTFYLGSDLEKAKFWYKQADKHSCRVIYNESCAT